MRINEMVETRCANCGKTQYTTYINLRKDTKVVYCSKLCETEHKNPHLKTKFGRK